MPGSQFIPSVATPTTDNAEDLGTSSLRWRDGYFGNSISIGTNPALTGLVRLANNGQITSRNAANSADINLLRLNSSDSVELNGINGLVIESDSSSNTKLGLAAGTTRIKTNKNTPATLAEGDWWIEISGTSPNRVASIRCFDSGAVRTIASSVAF